MSVLDHMRTPSALQSSLSVKTSKSSVQSLENTPSEEQHIMITKMQNEEMFF